jgi:hypothetical protein
MAFYIAEKRRKNESERNWYSPAKREEETQIKSKSSKSKSLSSTHKPRGIIRN